MCLIFQIFSFCWYDCGRIRLNALKMNENFGIWSNNVESWYIFDYMQHFENFKYFDTWIYTSECKMIQININLWSIPIIEFTWNQHKFCIIAKFSPSTVHWIISGTVRNGIIITGKKHGANEIAIVHLK